MGLLKKATNQTSFLKCGIHGFQGSGKTRTATEIAIGLALTIGDKKPVGFFDSETGSDFMIKHYDAAGLELLVHKSRAFKDVLSIIDEAEKECSVLVIDSVTHVWDDLKTSFELAFRRRNGLLFQDWSPIKREWKQFTTKFLNSKVHIIVCGRAGYEYDMTENEAGKKELIKTGNKMKAEGEMGYEPHLGLYMERIKKSETTGNPDDAGIINRCHVEKDRNEVLNGKVFDFPKFADFRSHIEFLNVGEVHVGVDDTRNSEDMFDNPEMSAAQYRQECEIAIDLIKSFFISLDLGSSNESKKKKQEMLENAFGTPSWKKVETLRLESLMSGYEKLKATYSKNTEENSCYLNEPPDDAQLALDGEE